MQKERTPAISSSFSAAIVAVIEVLREAVAEQDDMLGARGNVLKLFADVADRGAHPGGAFRLDGTDAGFNIVGQFLIEFLDDIELDVVAAVTGETHDGV